MATVQVRYDEFDNPQYFVNVPTGRYDYEGGEIFKQVPVSASEVKTETVNVPYGEDGGGSYQQYVVPSSVYQKAVDAVTPPPVSKDYTRPQEVSQSAVFQDVNPFSFGQLEKIYDSINSGAYKVSPDKSQLITPYGDFSLRPLGNGLYDIPIGARSGSYNVAIGITDDNKAVFNKDFIDAGAIRYQGGAPGGALQGLIKDIGPVGNIALAVATGGASIPTQLAAQTAYNMIGGADFEDALKGAALNVALAEGVKSTGLLGGDATKTSFAPEMGDEFIPFDEELTGIDIGDVIPTTPEQLRGLYETGGVFRPPMEGIDMGETIPFTPEQVSGLYPDNGAFLPVGYTGTEGLDTGDVIPYTEQQIAGLYPTDGKFKPPYVLPSVKDLANAAVAAKTVDSLLNPPSTGGGTTSGGGFAIVPIPSDWRSPTYNQAFTPIDLNSLFTTANLLKGTQWENLPPEIKFAAAPTMEALTNMISNGQTTTST